MSEKDVEGLRKAEERFRFRRDWDPAYLAKEKGTASFYDAAKIS